MVKASDPQNYTLLVFARNLSSEFVIGNPALTSAFHC